MLSTALSIIGVFAGFAASALAFFAGFMWRDVANAPGQTVKFRDAARFTGAALICGGVAGILLLGNALG